jgi:biopolymer transport protein TolQ
MASDALVLDAVLRSCRRAGANVHGSMMRRVTSLATVAPVAAFLGFFGTILGIVNSFHGFDGEKSAILAEINAGLSDAFAPTALGLMVAIPAFCFYKYLCERMEAFDTEMESAGLELVNCLALHLARVRSSA